MPRAILGADDSRGNGGVQAKGAANRQHPIAHLHAIGIAQLREREFLAGVNLDHRQVRGFIHAHHFRGVLGGVAVQLHLNLGGLFDNVVVRQDVAALVHDHAGTQAALGAGAAHPAGRQKSERRNPRWGRPARSPE